DEHADLRVRLRVRRADMAMQLGELKEATDELLEVAEQASELGRAEVEAEALLLLGDIDQRQGRPTDAHRRLLEAEELAASTDDLGSHRIEAEAGSWLGTVAYYRNRPEEAERLCLQARTWFERTGDSYFQVQNLVLGLAVFALGEGRAEEGEKWLREALPVAL